MTLLLLLPAITLKEVSYRSDNNRITVEHLANGNAYEHYQAQEEYLDWPNGKGKQSQEQCYAGTVEGMLVTGEGTVYPPVRRARNALDLLERRLGRWQ